MVSPLGDSLFGGLPVFLRMNISTFVFLSYELAHKLKNFWGAKKPQKAFVQTTRYPGARGCQKERDRERESRSGISGSSLTVAIAVWPCPWGQ